MRGVMDAVCEPGVREVVVMTSAQVGKTEALLNVIGYHVHQEPSPILVLLPTLDIGEAFSKDRLAPMLRDTPALRGKVRDARSRDSGNTLLHKTFPGGHVTIAGANSPASLASRPIRVVLADEVDRYPVSAGAEGDPLSLAQKRAQRFWNRRFMSVSTPTVKGRSRIEMAFEASDRRYFMVPCPDCGHRQRLVWAQVHWPEGRPEAAEYACETCGSSWSDAVRWAAVRRGEWAGTAPFTGVAGFHLSELYGPGSRLGEIAEAFLKAKRSPETLKAWVNTSLGETWEDQAERVDGHMLSARVEDWGDLAPAGVLLLTCGVDVQDTRVEVELVGWGVGEESWSLDYAILYGDPSAPEIWQQLDDYLLQRIETEDGRSLAVQAACVDSGGHHTQAVYRFCRERFRRRVFAIKGMAGPGRLVWPKRASLNNSGRVPLFLIGVDAAKDAVYARWRVDQPGPGYAHIPLGREPQWFEQATAEQVATKFVRGFPTRVWELPPGKRNEGLDCRVYAYAAMAGLNVNWGRMVALAQGERPPARPAPVRAAVFDSEPPRPDPPPPPPPPQQARQRRVVRSSYMMR